MLHELLFFGLLSSHLSRLILYILVFTDSANYISKPEWPIPICVYELIFLVIPMYNAPKNLFLSYIAICHNMLVSWLKATFTLIRVRVPSPAFGLRLVQASTVRVSVHGQLYKDNSAHVYRQSLKGQSHECRNEPECRRNEIS